MIESTLKVPAPKTIKRKVSMEETMAQILKDKHQFAKVLEHNSMYVGLYVPEQGTKQAPHDEDVLYIVTNGSGEFISGNQTTTFKTGDVLFVPANEVHQFSQFTENFQAWLIFYGAEGGKK